MANDVQVNLRFNADIQQARAQIESLQQSLQNLMTNSRSDFSTQLDKDLTKNIKKIMELKASLEQATNVKTGQLDLSKFNESLKKSNTSISEYAYTLYGLGPAGQQAFSQLAGAINSADMPLKRSNELLKDFATTLKNTVKWQISSSLIHGFVGSIEQAVGYAKDLDRSLNDIRIVSGASADEMAKFAQQANNAAKSLSTTTTDYTKAALIYYQQGLNDNEVKERTDITIKMANAAGESAQTISDQLTAVWNNFYDGSQSLEHYADAMAKLGADTASSSDEIAEGLEKFAAIGNTVGLGFDQSAAALATVTATTRQSAEVVGTAFKTLFARIQDLELGDTLEDGTTLGKYSEALNAVGINIKDSNGELKDMNIIIDEMGSKWQTLSKDQQVALAQTVAGTRQYTQLIALMENFDFYQENLQRAQNSDGTLQKQADIYAESWEAAGKRVKASAESIYNALLDDKFFIKLTDGFADFLNIINDTIKGIGGLQGAFSLLGGVILKVYSTEISSSLSNFAYNIQSLTKGGREKLFNQAAQLKQETNEALRGYANDGTNLGAVRTDVNIAQANAQDALIAKQAELLRNGQSLTETEQRIANLMMEQVKFSGEEVINTAQALQNNINQADAMERLISLRMRNGSGTDIEDYKDFKNQFDDFKSYQTQYGAGLQIQAQIEEELSKSFGSEEEKYRNITIYIEQLTQALKDSGLEANELFTALEKVKGANFNELNDSLGTLYTDIENIGNIAMNKLLGDGEDFSLNERAFLALPTNEYEHFSKTLERLQTLWTENGDLVVRQANGMRLLTNQTNEAENAFNNFNGKIPSISDGIVAFGQTLMSVSMLLSQIKGMVDVWNNEDMSFGEKMLSTFTSLGFTIPMVINGIQGLQTAFAAATGIQQVLSMATRAWVVENNAAVASMTAEQIAKKTGLSLDQAELALKAAKTAALVQETFALEGSIGKLTAKQLVEKTGMTIDQAKIVLQALKNKETSAEALAQAGLLPGKLANIAATIAESAAYTALSAAMGPVLAGIILLTASLLAIAAVVALVVVGIKALVDAYNADAIAAEKAAETAKELSETYDECAQSYQTMIDTMSQYEEALNSLENLTKGTDEYKQALQEANRAALELIQNNPGKFKAGEDYHWEDGQLVLEQEAMDAAKASGQQTLNNVYAAKVLGQAKADEAKAKSDSTNLSRKMYSESGLYDENGYYQNQFKKITEEARNIYTKDQNLFTNKQYMADALGLDQTNYTQQLMVDALWKNKDALEKLGNDTVAASDTYKLATETATKELLSNNNKVQNSEDKEGIENKSSSVYDNAYNNALQKLKDDGWGTDGIWKATTVNDKVKEVWEDYVKAADLEGTKVIDTTGTDSNRVFKYKDAEGNEKSVSLETMREVMATKSASEETDKSATQLAETLDRLNSFIKENKNGNEEQQKTAQNARAAKDFLLNENFGKVSKKNIATLRELIGENGENTEAYLDKLIGDGKDGKISDETAKQFGYNTAEELVKAFNQGLQDTEKDWGALEPPKSLSFIHNSSNISQETANNYIKQYNDISQGGYEGQLDRIIGDGKDGKISDETAQKAGYETAEQMVEAYKQAIIDGDLSNFVDNHILNNDELAAAAKERGYASGEALASGLSEGAINNFNADQFGQNITSILNTIPEAQKALAEETLSQVDWSSWDAAEDAENKLQALGICSENTSKIIRDLADSMRDCTGATKDLGTVNTALDEDVDEEEWENLAEHIQDVAESNDELSDSLKYNEKAAKNTAEAILRFDSAVASVNESYEDWEKTLKSGNIQDQAKAVKELRNVYSDLLDIDGSALSNEFLQSADNLVLLKQAAEGSEEAYRKLQEVAQQDILTQCGITMDDTDFWNKKAALDTALNDLNFSELEIGASLNSQPALDAMTDLVNAAGMTVDQATSYLSSMGVDAEVELQENKQPIERTVNSVVPTISDRTASIPVVAGDGSVENQTVTFPEIRYNAEPVSITDVNAGGGMSLKVTSANKSSGGGFKFKNSSNGSGVSSPKSKGDGRKGGGGGGGGGSSKRAEKPTQVKPTDKKKKIEEVERYHEISEILEDIQSELDDISDLKDEAFGADKLKAMDKEKNKLLELANAQQKYQDEIAKNLNDDKWEAKEVGAQFDENGRITNVQALQEQWMNEWNAQAAAFDAREQELENQLADAKNAENEDLQEQIEEQKDKLSDEREDYDDEYERKRDVISQYEETLNLSEEAKQQLEDYLRQIRQLNYEKLEYKLQIRVELNESDLADIEHILSRLNEDDYAKSAERIALVSKEAKTYKLMVDDQKRFIENLKAQYAAGDINQSDFIEGLKNAKDAVLEAETSIREGIVTVGDELRNAFSNVADELDKAYERMQRRLDFGDFYKEISKVINGETNYSVLNNIIDAQSSMTQARIDSRMQERSALIARQQELYKQYEQATADETKAQIRETLDEVESRIADTNSEIQSGIQELADYAQEKFENSIENIFKKWQETNFGGSLDDILDEIDLRNRAQEELLTTTNKVYETNKLIRQAEKDIDATTNKRAKQAYQEYIAKAKQKQEQNEMTQLELDLLTAEYEITKAQIALEEAQNAKDTVRLTRNSEGNFGYVYTANQDKVNDAQQSLEDATNKYYNVALEGAKSSSEQIYKLEQEWQEKVKEIYADTTLNAEEKSEKVQEITDYYYTMIEQQRDKYYIATDAMRESSYEHEVDYDMKSIRSAENWFNNHDALITKLEKAQRTYETEIEDVSENVEKAYGDQEDAVKYIDDATKLYSDELDDLIPKMETDLVKAIGTATEAWQEQLEVLQKLIEASDELMKENHDTLLAETYKDDYAAQISALLQSGSTYKSYDVQQLLRNRWNKLGGVDDEDYQALINAGGTSEQIALWEVLRRFKIEQTDWSASDKSYKDEMRQTKLKENYASLIEEYLNSPYGKWSDDQVQKYLMERQIKIDFDPEYSKQFSSNADLEKEMRKKYPKAFMASGGYTGDWGPSGKLAVLHEKELVLNADDTRNILTSVGIIREISKALDNSAVWAMFGQASLNAATVGASADSTLQQDVTIHADFPNVTDHNEIELAINNLINAASQYAYRT